MLIWPSLGVGVVNFEVAADLLQAPERDGAEYLVLADDQAPADAGHIRERLAVRGGGVSRSARAMPDHPCQSRSMVHQFVDTGRIRGVVCTMCVFAMTQRGASAGPPLQ